MFFYVTISVDVTYCFLCSCVHSCCPLMKLTRLTYNEKKEKEERVKSEGCKIIVPCFLLVLLFSVVVFSFCGPFMHGSPG